MAGLLACISGPPTERAWSEVVRLLSSLEGSALASAIAEARAVVAWPARLRHVDAACPWLAGLFDGKLDPRLELVGWASVKHSHDYRYLECNLAQRQLLRIVAAFARHLDPTFTAPDTLLEGGDDIRYASGCGGGSVWEKRGDASRGVLFSDVAIEHSAEMENDGSWVPYGLAEGHELTVARRDCIGGTYTFSATGPAHAVIELASVWGAMVRAPQAAPLDLDAVVTLLVR